SVKRFNCKSERDWHTMRHQPLSMFLGSIAGLVFLGSAVWLGLAVEAVGRLVPAGSDEFRIQAPSTISRVHISYRLPRGQTWSTVVERLTAQGWVISNDGEGGL